MTRRETVARVRLLSQARIARHGPMPDDMTLWWQQIAQLALDLDLPITYAEWDAVSVFNEQQQRESEP